MGQAMSVLLAGMLAVATAVDISGRWRAEFPGPGGQSAFEELNLAVHDGVVTGTMANAVGGVGQIHDGRWDGKVLRFWVPWDAGDRLEGSGTLAGDALRIDMKTRQWRATHVFKRVTGATSS